MRSSVGGAVSLSKDSASTWTFSTAAGSVVVGSDSVLSGVVCVEHAVNPISNAAAIALMVLRIFSLSYALIIRALFVALLGVVMGRSRQVLTVRPIDPWRKTMSIDNIIDPESFDLDAFVNACTQATRYVSIVQDQRLVGKLLQLRKEYLMQLELAADDDTEHTVVAMGDVSDLERAKAAYTVAYKEFEAQKQVVEIRAVEPEKRTAILDNLLAEHDITKEELGGRDDLLEELDYRTMVDAFAAPKFTDVGQVKRFAKALGEGQWAQIKAAWAEALTQAVDLERLSPDFLPRSLSKDGGEEY